jgi:hypothetical protein
LKKRNQTPLECWEQEQYFKWVYANQIKIPELQLVNGSMNGVRVPVSIIKKLKGQGLRSGIPDIDIPVRRLRYSGLRIELKRIKGGSVSPEQKRYHELLRRQGYRVDVCRGWREAVTSTIEYLELPRLSEHGKKGFIDL